MPVETRAFNVVPGDTLRLTVSAVNSVGGGGDEDEPAVLQFNCDGGKILTTPYAALVSLE